MDFVTNQWVPARRAIRPEFQFKAAPVPEVVRIPVRFVGGEDTRAASALKIQKVFRGYLVRKSVRKIIGIKRAVDSIEARVSEKEVLDLIREKDGKERLKINESLMALLFKLDAVSCCGDLGIRLCRKAVIRKVIELQEKVDTLANDRTLDEKLGVEDLDMKPAGSDQIHEELMSDSSVSKDGKVYELFDLNVPAAADVDDDDCAFGAGLKGDISSSMVVDEMEIGVVMEKPVGSGGDGDPVEQNGKMMKMMAELLEKSEAQAKMLSSLTERLEQVEKAYVCDKIDKLKRKKKKLSP